MKNHALLSTALLAALSLSLPVLAADTASVTIVDGDFSDSVSVPLDELKVGESRQLTAASGVPAIVSRSEEGLSIEIAGHSVDVPFGGAHLQALHAHGGKHPLQIIAHEDEQVGDGSNKRVVVKHVHHGEGQDADGKFEEADIEAMIERLRSGEGDGDDGERRVVVIRKVDAPKAQTD